MEGEDAEVTEIERERERERQQDGRNNMQARVAESGNGKLDHQFFFSIHFDLRNCTVSIGCYLGHLKWKRKRVKNLCEE